MRLLAGRMRRYWGGTAFVKRALLVMVPVMVQQLINNLFNMVDNVMVGSLDTAGLAMTAVSVANKPYTVFFGVFFGLTGAGGLMISQYYGARDMKTCQGLFSFELVLGMANSLLFFALLQLFPQQLMRLFVTDARTIELGIRYLRIVSFSYLLVALSSTCIFSLRAIGQNKMCMVVSLATMAINALCNYVLIFGKLGLPAMGVEGAALGTLIARFFEMLFYIVLLLRGRLTFRFRPLAFLGLPRHIMATFLRKAVPLVINELLWSIGLTVFYWGYSRLDEPSLPAITVADLCFQIAAVLAMGTASAVSVLIGTELGAGRLVKARENCKKLLGLVVLIGLCSMTLCIALSFVMPMLFALTDELKRTSTLVAVLQAVSAPINFVYGFCFFCLRAGGDTREAMLLDSGYLWAIPVPACIAMALLLPGRISLAWGVVIVNVLTSLKVVFALKVLKKGYWIRNITVADA